METHANTGLERYLKRAVMRKLQFMKYNDSFLKWLFYCFLVIGIVCVLFACWHLFSQKKSENKQDQIQSTNKIQIHAGKVSLNAPLTNNISEIWFSETLTDGPVDIHRACVRYKMTDAEISEFSKHYSDYAVINIPLRIENMSNVTIGGFQISFVKETEEKSIWLYREYLQGEYGLVESGTTGYYTAQALVNLSVCPIDKADELIQHNGIKLMLEFTLRNGQQNQKKMDVIFD